MTWRLGEWRYLQRSTLLSINCMHGYTPYVASNSGLLDKITQSIPSLTQPCNKMLVRCRSHSAKYPRSRSPLTKWHHLAFIYLRWPVGLATSVARPPIFIVHLLVYLLSVLTEEKSKSDFAWGNFLSACNQHRVSIITEGCRDPLSSRLWTSDRTPYVRLC